MLGTCYLGYSDFLLKIPWHSGQLFPLPPCQEPWKLGNFFWELHKTFAAFDVKALVVPECSTWKLNTCGPLEAFLRALSSRGGSNQGEKQVWSLSLHKKRPYFLTARSFITHPRWGPTAYLMMLSQNSFMENKTMSLLTKSKAVRIRPGICQHTLYLYLFYIFIFFNICLAYKNNIDRE